MEKTIIHSKPKRHWAVRIFFALFWLIPIVFFMNMIVGGRLNNAVGEAYFGPLFFVEVFVWGVLLYRGSLPFVSEFKGEAFKGETNA